MRGRLFQKLSLSTALFAFLSACGSLVVEDDEVGRTAVERREIVRGAGLYPERDLSSRTSVLSVPGLVFDIVAERRQQDSRSDLILVHRKGEFLQRLVQSSARSFEPGEKLEGLGFHPNTIARLPGPQPAYLVNAEGAQSLISFGLNEKGYLEERARVAHRPSFSTTPFLSPKHGLSLVVTPYERGFVDLLLGFDPVSGVIAQEAVIELALDDVAGQALAIDLNSDGVTEILLPTRRSRQLWKITGVDAGSEPSVEAVWSFEEGAPRMMLEADLFEGEKGLLVPLDGAGKIAVLGVSQGAAGGEISQRAMVAFPSRFGPGRIALGFDADGSVIFAADGDNELVLYRLDAGAQLESIRAYRITLGVGAQHFSFSDVDGDGHLDLVMSLRRREDSIAILYGPLSRLVGDLGSGLRGERVVIEVSSDRTPVVSVAGRILTREEITATMVKGGAGHLLETPRGRHQALDLVINEALLDEAAYREGLDRLQLENKFFPLPFEPEEVTAKQHYRDQFESFGLPERVHLIQIQFRADLDEGGREAARSRANTALQRLQAGEDFSLLAAELTENPRAKERGGNVGFVSRNADSWLKGALAGLDVGDRTDVVESAAGFEILKIIDRHDPIVQPYEEIAEAVKWSWRKEQQSSLRRQYLEALKQNLVVERIMESNER